MKRVKLENCVKIVGIKNFKGADKLIDYYLLIGNERRIYAFSRTYTHTTYDMCKSGIMLNELLRKKSRDTGVMRLVKYTGLMLPYLVEEYALPLAS